MQQKKILESFLPKFFTEAKKSGPNLPIGFWLEQDLVFKNKLLSYLKKNISYVRDFLSEDLAKCLINNEIDSIDKNFIIRFRVFCMIIWYKIKIEKSISNPSLSLERILET